MKEGTKILVCGTEECSATDLKGSMVTTTRHVEKPGKFLTYATKNGDTIAIVKMDGGQLMTVPVDNIKVVPTNESKKQIGF